MGVEITSAPPIDKPLLTVTLVGPPPAGTDEVVVQVELRAVPAKLSEKTVVPKVTWPPPVAVALTAVLLWVPLEKAATLDWVHAPDWVVNDHETGAITFPERSSPPL